MSHNLTMKDLGQLHRVWPSLSGTWFRPNHPGSCWPSQTMMTCSWHVTAGCVFQNSEGLCRTNGTFASAHANTNPWKTKCSPPMTHSLCSPGFGNASYDYKNLGRHLVANSPGHQDLSVVHATTPLTKTHFTWITGLNFLAHVFGVVSWKSWFSQHISRKFPSQTLAKYGSQNEQSLKKGLCHHLLWDGVLGNGCSVFLAAFFALYRENRSFISPTSVDAVEFCLLLACMESGGSMALILVICQKIGQMRLTPATFTKSAFFGGGPMPGTVSTNAVTSASPEAICSMSNSFLAITNLSAKPATSLCALQETYALRES